MLLPTASGRRVPRQPLTSFPWKYHSLVVKMGHARVRPTASYPIRSPTPLWCGGCSSCHRLWPSLCTGGVCCLWRWQTRRDLLAQGLVLISRQRRLPCLAAHFLWVSAKAAERALMCAVIGATVVVNSRSKSVRTVLSNSSSLASIICPMALGTKGTSLSWVPGQCSLNASVSQPFLGALPLRPSLSVNFATLSRPRCWTYAFDIFLGCTQTHVMLLIRSPRKCCLLLVIHMSC